MASWTVESIGNYVAANTKLELNLHELADLLNRIKTQEKVMRSFVSNYNDLERSTLQEFALWTTGPDTMAVQGLLDRIHVLVIGSAELENFGNVGVLQMLANNLEVNLNKNILSFIELFAI